jgi:hypothetical protein
MSFGAATRQGMRCNPAGALVQHHALWRCVRRAAPPRGPRAAPPRGIAPARCAARVSCCAGAQRAVLLCAPLDRHWLRPPPLRREVQPARAFCCPEPSRAPAAAARLFRRSSSAAVCVRSLLQRTSNPRAPPPRTTGYISSTSGSLNHSRQGFQRFLDLSHIIGQLIQSFRPSRPQPRTLLCSALAVVGCIRR